MNQTVEQFDPVPAQSTKPLWEERTEEQPYARLSDTETGGATNRYGQKIDLLDLTEHRFVEGRSLHINGNPEVGCNPNRNKQHGFYFTADNCIGCHACEAACAEKNETPSHLAFRSVGYLEGGSFPAYQRLNVSMACNHCDDPVCLKGCPTGAYTKHTEYGAVLQDPDTCFGCGYCTWVCPYNAPQLDPEKGQVSKCNMCVDRLEVGLKPACVSACVGNALDFGVIEDVPDNRLQAEANLPGFPDPEISRPNIRFQQTTTLPDELKRPDSNPLKYQRSADSEYSVAVDRKHGEQRHWSLRALSSRENVLVAFTLASQAGIGLFSLLTLTQLSESGALAPMIERGGYLLLGALSLGLVALALFMSTVHLGKPLRFYRGFNNFKYSPVSREGLGIALFMGFLGLHLLLWLPSDPLVQSTWLGHFGAMPSIPDLSALLSTTAWLAVAAGAAGLYFMIQCYRIKARPFWNHWQTGTAFVGSALALGGLAAMSQASAEADRLFACAVLLGTSVEVIGLFFHARDMREQTDESAAAHYLQTTRFGKIYYLRNVVLSVNIVLIGLLTVLAPGGWIGLAGWLTVAVLLLATSLVGRALFYVLVIPTTLPGAFFWRNPAFEEHARNVGLANPQTGVYPLDH